MGTVCSCSFESCTLTKGTYYTAIYCLVVSALEIAFGIAILWDPYIYNMFLSYYNVYESKFPIDTEDIPLMFGLAFLLSGLTVLVTAFFLLKDLKENKKILVKIWIIINSLLVVIKVAALMFTLSAFIYPSTKFISLNMIVLISTIINVVIMIYLLHVVYSYYKTETQYTRYIINQIILNSEKE